MSSDTRRDALWDGCYLMVVSKGLHILYVSLCGVWVSGVCVGVCVSICNVCVGNNSLLVSENEKTMVERITIYHSFLPSPVRQSFHTLPFESVTVRAYCTMKRV